MKTRIYAAPAVKGLIRHEHAAVKHTLINPLSAKHDWSRLNLFYQPIKSRSKRNYCDYHIAKTKWPIWRKQQFCETHPLPPVTPLPHTPFCETQWRHSVKTKLYKTPPPDFIVSVSSVKTKVKVIEFHRIVYCRIYREENKFRNLNKCLRFQNQHLHTMESHELLSCGNKIRDCISIVALKPHVGRKNTNAA